MRSSSSFVLATCAAAGLASCALAQVNPVSYDTPNGYTGSYTYWDESYNGAGQTNVDGAALTGGLGDLTDGAVASDNWFVAEAPDGPGPYVGWNVDPELTFHFAGSTEFFSVSIHFDDADGSGGVSAPANVLINGQNFPVGDQPGAAPFWATFDVSGLTTDTVSIRIQRANSWVFASEVAFNGVPAPSTAALGLLGLAAASRRRRA